MARNSTNSDCSNMQLRTRRERNFDETEADLPDVSGAASRTLSQLLKDGKARNFNHILSWLGPRNPIPRQVAADDTVWLLDNTAYRNPNTGKWEAEFVSAVFAQHPSCHVIDAVTSVANTLGLDESDPNYPTIQQRILPFLQDIRPGTQVKILQDGKNRMKLGPGGRNGISSDIKKLPSHNREALMPTFAEVPEETNGVLEMKTHYAEPKGWGVISDIDDTIKITMTSDPIGILRSTFVDVPTPCPGMPDLYRYMSDLIEDTSPFFYLSASPYNLYPFLRRFLHNHYPHGTVITRDSSWMSISDLLKSLTLGTEEYKVDRMQKIHGWLPQRKMICIGDSTQADPEAYATIAREHPDWVKLILIRKVTDIAAIGIEAKNEPERFEKAFKYIPKEKWHVFDSDDPTECRDIIRNLVSRP